MTQHCLLKRIICSVLLFCHNLSSCVYVGLFLGFLFLVSLSLCPFYTTLITIVLQSVLISDSLSPQTQFLFFKIFLAILGSFYFHINFIISLSTLPLTPPLIKTPGIASIDTFGKTGHLSNP